MVDAEEDGGNVSKDESCGPTVAVRSIAVVFLDLPARLVPSPSSASSSSFHRLLQSQRTVKLESPFTPRHISPFGVLKNPTLSSPSSSNNTPRSSFFLAGSLPGRSIFYLRQSWSRCLAAAPSRSVRSSSLDQAIVVATTHFF